LCIYKTKYIKTTYRKVNPRPPTSSAALSAGGYPLILTDCAGSMRRATSRGGARQDEAPDQQAPVRGLALS